MTKDEMKNRISMALKDPILQQGFEIICKEIAQLKEANQTLATMNESMWVEMKRAERQGIANKLHQLAKAKEIIKGLLELGSIGDGDYTYVMQAEQFLSEVEK